MLRLADAVCNMKRETPGPAHRKLYRRQIEATDAETDALVYELYGLTEEEVAIVEGRDH